MLVQDLFDRRVPGIVFDDKWNDPRFLLVVVGQKCVSVGVSSFQECLVQEIFWVSSVDEMFTHIISVTVKFRNCGTNTAESESLTDGYVFNLVFRMT